MDWKFELSLKKKILWYILYFALKLDPSRQETQEVLVLWGVSFIEKSIMHLMSLLFLALLCAVKSFVPLKGRWLASASVQPSYILTLAKKPAQKEENTEYWQGEWVCADCGYVYDKDLDGGGLYFEQQGRGFVCPQCSAPRKRYAKKVGDQWGVTRDGGDFPIYFFTFVGLAIVTWFSLVYVPTM